MYSRCEKGRLWSGGCGERDAVGLQSADLNRRAVSAVTCSRYPKRWVNQRSKRLLVAPDAAEGFGIDAPRAREDTGNEMTGGLARTSIDPQSSLNCSGENRAGHRPTTVTTISLITNRPFRTVDNRFRTGDPNAPRTEPPRWVALRRSTGR